MCKCVGAIQAVLEVCSSCTAVFAGSGCPTQPWRALARGSASRPSLSFPFPRTRGHGAPAWVGPAHPLPAREHEPALRRLGPGAPLLVLHRPSVCGEKRVSRRRVQPQALSDEGRDQALGPLLVLPQHLAGRPDLVPLHAVQERHADDGGCRTAKVLHYLAPDDRHPGLKTLPRGEGKEALLPLPSPGLTGDACPISFPTKQGKVATPVRPGLKARRGMGGGLSFVLSNTQAF